MRTGTSNSTPTPYLSGPAVQEPSSQAGGRPGGALCANNGAEMSATAITRAGAIVPALSTHTVLMSIHASRNPHQVQSAFPRQLIPVNIFENAAGDRGSRLPRCRYRLPGRYDSTLFQFGNRFRRHPQTAENLGGVLADFWRGPWSFEVNTLQS